MSSFRRLLTRFDNKLANKYIYILSFSSFLLIHVTSFSIGIVKVMYFLVFSPKQVNCLSNSSVNSFMIK